MALEGLSFEPQNNADSIQTPFWHPEESDYEDHERYCQGGYCPITLYQKLKNERYRIEYKLGHGHFATVWLARDTQSPEKRQVALKILTADKTTGSLEAQLLRMIAASISPPSPGPTYVVDILDEFEVVSANGNHRVLVMPVTRSMTCLSNSKIPFRSVAKSLLKGLARIHSAGIVHGDLHPGNIGFRFNLRCLPRFFPPQLAILPPNNHRPSYLVSREAWEEEPDPYMWTQIKGHYLPIILDFGNAYHLSERKPLGGNPKAIPNHYIPPEHIFGRPDLLNQKTDVWALGALIYQLGTDIRLISSSDRKSSLLRIDDRLAPGWTADLSNEITPSDFWKRTFKRLEKRLKDVGDEDLFKDFLLSMLALDPSNRLSAEDLLSHTYLSEVSLCGATSL